MKKNYWIKFLFGIGIILAIVAGCGSDNNDNDSITPDPDDGKTRSFLFVQNAASGTFVSDGTDNYTLTLNGISPQTIYFSDRPVRDAGQVAMQQFLDSGCFNSNNPSQCSHRCIGYR